MVGEHSTETIRRAAIAPGTSATKMGYRLRAWGWECCLIKPTGLQIQYLRNKENLENGPLQQPGSLIRPMFRLTAPNK